MTASIINFLLNFPPEIATFIMAMIPVGELRLSLPVAILLFKLPVWEALILSIAGNFIPVILVGLLADKFNQFLEKKSNALTKKWTKTLQDSRKKANEHYAKYGLIGLMIFIGIPVPFTGVWTAALATFVFGISFRRAWPYFLGGIIISSSVTLLITFGVIKIF